MTTALFVALVIAVWVLSGVIAAVVLLGRQGYRDWHWYVLGALLGPMFVPIAAERPRTRPRTLERTAHTPEGDLTGVRTALVAVDGSAESRQAIADASRLLGSAESRIVLATVVDAESGKAKGDTDRARALLTECAGDLGGNGGPAVVTEIGSGKPSAVLLQMAADENADIIVIGRRGKGLSRRLLGSVADEMVRRSPLPVLLATAPNTVRDGGGDGAPGTAGSDPAGDKGV
ncbi:universal stress protein [Streptomyces sp. ST2-7A]|uniref:universal stress protein n=1 Tax=Streptomyces sp. ST2-7A TaxID=2907214 RepID=UPI001F171C1E|nr:universal stress protein [Streptomyces sp. ST2-7A]MCE7082670.1 universal stress protein [Streptomyces sp. ST2-7A]